MKHPSTRAVFEYWNKRRGTRPAPERGDIEPSEIRLALGDTFMLAADFVDQLRFRLAGTRVCALFCREIKGEVFSEAFSATSRKPAEELMTIVNEEQVGIVAGIAAHTDEGRDAELEMLLLPLAHSGHARIRALGVLAPTVPPYWLGAQAVTSLDLVTLRHIGPEVKGRGVPRFGRAAEGSRLRHGFVVYSGGRETPSGDATG
ncbi:MAG TPA: PAS domain-containing protein [Pseudolabrys sp.]|nr:PAS domain-containing protein [Pseudolabrys sp.]